MDYAASTAAAVQSTEQEAWDEPTRGSGLARVRVGGENWGRLGILRHVQEVLQETPDFGGNSEFGQFPVEFPVAGFYEGYSLHCTSDSK